MAETIEISVRPGRLSPIFNRHPWVHLQSIACPNPEPERGAVVDLVQPNGRWLARGLYNPTSRLRVRLYTWNAGEHLDDAFFCKRIDQAISRREQVGYRPDSTTAYRLIFSEADGLSGLIVDRYGDYLVIQLTAAGLSVRLPTLLQHLSDRLSPKGILVRVDQQTAKAEGLEPGDHTKWGDLPTEPIEIREHGINYLVDLQAGQKTGLYLDQRDNRLAAAKYMKDRRVLDVCSYVGGFALVAAKLGQAAEVIGLDTSAWAVSAATENAVRNEIPNVTFEQGDCFESLAKRHSEGEKFGAVILDPPRFAGSRQGIDQALRAYQRLNRDAIGLLPEGGILVTSSCSGRVSRLDFTRMLHDVGRQAGRDLVVLESRGAASDHPFRVSCPESDYLKCLIVQVC